MFCLCKSRSNPFRSEKNRRLWWGSNPPLTAYESDVPSIYKGSLPNNTHVYWMVLIYLHVLHIFYRGINGCFQSWRGHIFDLKDDSKIVFQGDLFTGALFIQQSLRWNLYLCIFILVMVTGILTMTGKLKGSMFENLLVLNISLPTEHFIMIQWSSAMKTDIETFFERFERRDCFYQTRCVTSLLIGRHVKISHHLITRLTSQF